MNSSSETAHVANVAESVNTVAKLEELKDAISTFLKGELDFKFIKELTETTEVVVEFDVDSDGIETDEVYSLNFEIFLRFISEKSVNIESYISAKELKKHIKKTHSTDIISHINSLFKDEICSIPECNLFRPFVVTMPFPSERYLQLIGNELYLIIVEHRDYDLQKGDNL